MAYLLENISFTSISITAAYIVACANFRRKSFTKVLEKVNEKNWQLIESDQMATSRDRRNKIQIYSIGICVTFHGIIMVLWISFVAQFVGYDRLQYKVYFESIRVINNLQLVAQISVLLWIVLHLAAWFSFLTDIFLRLGLFYNILGDRLRALGNRENNPDKNISELKSIISELGELDRIMGELNSVFGVYIPPVLIVTIYSTGLYVANLLNASSVMEALYFMVYPIWQIIYLSLFCYWGQLIKDAVSYPRVLQLVLK